jgi:hypothetical protein
VAARRPELGKDANEIATRLTNNLYAYAHVERAIKGNMQGMLQRLNGPDPAAQ